MRVFSDFRRGIGLAAIVVAGLGLGACAGGPAEVLVAGTARTGVDAPPGSNEDFIVNVGRRIFFTENSSELSETAKDTLKLQADWLNRYPSYKLKIEGFADEPGTAEFNQKLGVKRAEAVRAWFLAAGFPATRMRTKSFGNIRPVNKCAELSCYAQNRRAVTVLDTEVGS